LAATPSATASSGGSGGSGGDVDTGRSNGGSRGNSGERVENDTAASQGLDLEYATAWSYGIGESLNMFIPNFRGGSSSVGFDTDGEVAGVLRRSGISSSVAAQLPGYWGTQPFTGGPTYIGAVVVFLFVLGMFVLPGRKKWWVFAVCLLGLLLAWGRNAMWFTEFAFWALPGYNKFRTVSMALAILQWALPFVAALVMSGLWKGEFSQGVKLSEPAERKRFMRGLWWSLGITGGVALFFALFGGMIYDFSAAGDGQLSGIPGLVDAVRSERAAMFRADCWRSLMFVALTGAVVWAWAVGIKGLRRWMPVAAMAALVLVDLVPVDVKYLSHSDFRTRSRVSVAPDDVDRKIMADREPGFRVLNTDNPFNEAFTSYFHRSVGGYHGAKLRRYQDIIDRYLSKFDMGVLNMLNTKYFIVTDNDTGERYAELNRDANGAAWMVDDVVFVNGAREELDALGTIDNKRQAVVDERFRGEIKIAGAGVLKAAGTTEQGAENGGTGTGMNASTSTGTGTGATTGNEAKEDFTPVAEIELTEYQPNYLRYETLAEREQVAVFSEIYYDKGWTAYIDGKPTPYFRADYLLRAMVIPAGAHSVEWRFRAPHFAVVEGVTLACSILILLWLAAGIFFERKKLFSKAQKTTENNQPPIDK
jgi:hypothetical protein